MGDRRVIQDIPDDYFKRLEELMETITSTVLESGLAVPLFHVFTETLMPCPSSETGTFDEMPQWHVNKEEVWLIVFRVNGSYAAVFGFVQSFASFYVATRHSMRS